MQVFNTWLERSQPNWNGHRLMNRAEPKATIFVNDPPVQSERPKHRDYHGFICRHCDKFTTGVPYRVMSEEAGVVLLDMIVCHSCCERAKNLGLHVKEIKKEERIIKRAKTLRSKE